MKTLLQTEIISKGSCLVAALLVALASPAHAEPPSNRADPCLLVTAADAQAAVGVAMGQPKGMDDGLYRHCTYVSPDGRFYLYVSTFGDDEASFEKGRRLTRENRTVAGLGASAYSDTERHMLLIYKNGILLNIQVGDHSGKLSGAQMDAAEVKAAAAAVPRL